LNINCGILKNLVEVKSISQLTAEKEAHVNKDSLKTMSTPISLGHGPELDRIASKYPDIFCGRVRGIIGNDIFVNSANI